MQVDWDVRLDADAVSRGGADVGARALLLTTVWFSQRARAALPGESHLEASQVVLRRENRSTRRGDMQ
jgi:hypothetical protein